MRVIDQPLVETPFYGLRQMTWHLCNEDHLVNEAVQKFGPPEIMNTDQGAHFTGCEWTSTLTEAKAKISMDGKGRWINDRMIERLWRSLKYECVYPTAFETGSEAREGIGKWLAYYNADRPHSQHGILTPDEAYETHRATDKKAT